MSTPFSSLLSSRHSTSTPLYSTPLHSTPLHSTPLHSTPLHSSPLHAIPLHCLPSFLLPFPSRCNHRARDILVTPPCSTLLWLARCLLSSSRHHSHFAPYRPVALSPCRSVALSLCHNPVPLLRFLLRFSSPFAPFSESSISSSSQGGMPT